MTSHEATLLDFLQSSEATPAAKALLLKRTLQEFVLEYGWWYEPANRPEYFPVGKPQQCHKNAFDLILPGDSLIYCEGYAVFQSGMTPTLHAWVTDGMGYALDNTWSRPGVAYAGIPFTSVFIAMMALKNLAMISLLDDWQNSYPLRGDLGDRPEEWLELRGRGKASVSPEETVQ